MITKAQITDIKSLRDKEGRIAHSCFVAEGEKVFSEIVKSSLSIKQIFYMRDRVSDDTFSHIRRAVKERSCEVIEVTAKEMERLSHLKSTTPIIVTVEISERDFNYQSGSLVLALSGVQDPGNLGTIVRIADWFGIRDIICSVDCADVHNPKVVQATMGSIARVRVHYLQLDSTLKQLQSEGVRIFGTFLDGKVIYDCSVAGTSGVIVMGNEGRGISDSIAEIVTDRLFIPPFAAESTGGESLNVAVATAIVCNEFRRC